MIYESVLRVVFIKIAYCSSATGSMLTSILIYYTDRNLKSCNLTYKINRALNYKFVKVVLPVYDSNVVPGIIALCFIIYS